MLTKTEISNKYSTTEEHKACRECIIKNYMACPVDHFVSDREEEKGIAADFKYCIFSEIARTFYEQLRLNDKRVREI